MQFNHARKGFSLLELMVVLAIIIILSTLGILNYANLHNNTEAESAAQRIAATFAAARQYAITNNAPYQVFFSRKDSAFWIDELDISGAVKRRQIENPGFLPQFISFESFVVGGVEQIGDTVSVRFWPDGHAETATVRVFRSVDDASDRRNTATVRLFGPTGVTDVSTGGA